VIALGLHVEEAKVRQPGFSSRARSRYYGAPAPVSHAGSGLKLKEDAAKTSRLR
jgi:hypothetical protein